MESFGKYMKKPKVLQLETSPLLLFLFILQQVSYSAKLDPGLPKILTFFLYSEMMLLGEQLVSWSFFQQRLWMVGWLVLVLQCLLAQMLLVNFCLSTLSVSLVLSYST